MSVQCSNILGLKISVDSIQIKVIQLLYPLVPQLIPQLMKLTHNIQQINTGSDLTSELIPHNQLEKDHRILLDWETST